MKPTFLAVCCIAIIVCVLSGRLIAQDNAAPAAVTAYVTVADKKGNPETVDPTQLTVSVDGQTAKLLSVHRATENPLLYAVLVDVSASSVKQAAALRNATAQLFQMLSEDGARGYLVPFNERMGVSREPVSATQVTSALNGIQFGGGTALYDAIRKTCDVVLDPRTKPGNMRRMMIVLSDGGDNMSKTRPADAEKLAEDHGITIFFIYTKPEEPTPLTWKNLREISRPTGGEVIVPHNLEEGISAMAGMIRAEWAIQFLCPANLAKGRHELSVKLAAKGITISAPAHVVTQ